MYTTWEEAPGEKTEYSDSFDTQEKVIGTY